MLRLRGKCFFWISKNPLKGQFEFEFLSPASAKPPRPQRGIFVWFFSRGGPERGDAEFGEKLFELDAILK